MDRATLFSPALPWILMALVVGCGSSHETSTRVATPTIPAVLDRLGPDSDLEEDRENARQRRSLIGCGRSHVCTLTPSGEASCWGGNELGETDAPEGPYVSLAVGEPHSCGLRADPSENI
jgi:hypothetical protein